VCVKLSEKDKRRSKRFSFKNGLYFKLQNVISQETLALLLYCPFPTSFFTTLGRTYNPYKSYIYPLSKSHYLFNQFILRLYYTPIEFNLPNTIYFMIYILTFAKHTASISIVRITDIHLVSFITVLL
jgi:hypothetical protein